jgi:DNA-binding winged helix-turn-helix (wHTH) protein/tetratricopeptide (TPR) repeat protein
VSCGSAMLEKSRAPSYISMHSASPIRAVVRFGVFEADVDSGELRKNGIKVKIQDLPFRALKLLLSNPNEVLSRDRFRQELWPEGVFVDFDHGISSAINRLRDALGDSADNPVFIETVERRGYRWIAPTHVPAPPSVQPGAVPPGPVLVKAEAARPVQATAASALRWRLLIFPAMLLLLVVWSLWPKFRSAKAKAARPAAVPTVESLPGPHSANSEAEQFYLKGRFYWEKRTPDGLNKAVDFFTQAIVHDPTYAPAYVGLADCYNLMREYTMMPASEAYPRALAAAQKAVELDDQSSEAHASLAFALFFGSWKIAEADHEFRRAIDLNPNNAVALHWYATYLFTIGRHTESVQEIEKAQSLDPASKSILADKGYLLWATGRTDEGAALLKQLATAERDFVSPHRYLKSIYFASGDYALYLGEWKKESSLLRDDPSLKLVDAAQKGFALRGFRGMLENTLDLQKKLYERGLQSPYLVAQTASRLGSKSEALRYLRIAFDKHDEQVIQINNDWAFETLHTDPGYRELVARLGIPSKE